MCSSSRCSLPFMAMTREVTKVSKIIHTINSFAIYCMSHKSELKKHPKKMMVTFLNRKHVLTVLSKWQ